MFNNFHFPNMLLSKNKLHLLPLFHLFLHLFFLELPTGNAAFNPICSTAIYDGVNISYPFWLNKNVDIYCGYPGFCLTCSEDGTKPTLALPEETYDVTDINYDNNTITLVHSNTLDDPYCTSPPHNPTVGTLPLYYNNRSLDTSVSYYFNCSFYDLNFSANMMGCYDHVTYSYSYSYMFIAGEEPEGFDSRNCSEKAVVAVKATAVNALDFAETLRKARNEVFVLGWNTAKECVACEYSNGRCGYNNGTQQFLCFCDDESIKINGTYCSGSGPGSKSVLTKTLIVMGAVIGGLALTIIPFFLIKKQQLFSKRYFGHQEIEDFIKQHGCLALKRYKYSEVKRMTNSFKDKLGQGGYGIVYKGVLQNGCSVAVKILNTSKENGEEFINEVVSITRTSHVNIVTLLGFCFEGKRRALIYEFMANGSLDKFIHDRTSPTLPHADLGWEKLHRIALGIARGLEYLHRGCNTRILHFDIKPHNILLDEEFHPKISDFGLAKLCPKRESLVSMMIARGTIGYIAPEVFNRNFGGVSSKSDVYSYGMMVLEMIGVTKKTNVDVDGSSQLYYPDWIYKHVELSKASELCGNLTSEESEILKKMTLIGLWCIQMKPSERPSMSRVIEMLEGSAEALQIPPNPFFTPQQE